MLEQPFLPVTDEELESIAITGVYVGGATILVDRLVASLKACRAILKNLPPRDVVAAAAKAGIPLRHPEVPESMA